MSFDPHAVGRLVSRDPVPVLDLFGPTVEPLTAAEPADPTAPGLIRGTVPPGQVIPVHAHGDPETFYVLSGELDALSVDDRTGPLWTPVAAGEVFHVPPDARHALRNRAAGTAVVLIVTTAEVVRFFDSVGTPVAGGEPAPPPSPEAVRRFLAESAARGYWNGSPEENAAVGIELAPAPGG